MRTRVLCAALLAALTFCPLSALADDGALTENTRLQLETARLRMQLAETEIQLRFLTRVIQIIQATNPDVAVAIDALRAEQQRSTTETQALNNELRPLVRQGITELGGDPAVDAINLETLTLIER